MVLVDTSAWIEWLTDGPAGASVAPLLPWRDEWVVPTLVQFELSKWLLRERGEDAADEVLAYTMKCVVVPLDTSIALAAASLGRDHGLATADAIVYTTALHHDAELITCDRHFEGLPRVRYVPKV